MKSAIVRGTPYTSMEYKDATPRLVAQRPITSSPIIDNDPENTLECGQGVGSWSTEPKLVNHEIRVHFDISDFTWLIFVSEPTMFTCSNKLEPVDTTFYPPGFVPPYSEKGKFELKAVSPMRVGMVRVALGNNCTTGQNAIRKYHLFFLPILLIPLYTLICCDFIQSSLILSHSYHCRLSIFAKVEGSIRVHGSP